MVNETLMLLFAITVIIIIHELGHYLIFKWYGYNPKIKIKWWGILMGEELVDNIRLHHIQRIRVVGIFTGILPGLILLNSNWILIGLLFGSLDIVAIIAQENISKKFGMRKELSWELSEKYLKEELKKIEAIKNG